MKKTLGLLLLLVLTVVGVFLLENQTNQVFLTDGQNQTLAIDIQYDMGKVTIEPWLEEESGIWYVFFPSFVKKHSIQCTDLQYGDLYINGEKITGDFEWQDGVIYEVVYGEEIRQMVFLEDNNVSTLFITTESGSNDFIRAAKENEEKGQILSLDYQGNVQYGGSVIISGHGNAWEFYDKRAYDLKLEHKGSLAGMEADNQWKLLHLSNDGDKIHSKLAYDIAEILEAEYVPQCTWANVYFNGEYNGMYLLATAVRNRDVFKTKEAVLLEKDLPDRYALEEHVVTEEENGFTIHRPKYPDEKQVEEIGELVQTIEDAVTAGELKEDLIDLDSFAKQFLIEEIAYNADAFETSSYFYRLAEGTPLKAGPPWDYDAAFGEAINMGIELADPTSSIMDEETKLSWYRYLLEQPLFLEMVTEKYRSVIPQLKELYTSTIDLYADYIEASVRNDNIRWKGYFPTIPKTGTYQTWENNVRYLKYFCYTRFNSLADRWGPEGEKLVWTGTGEEHTVRLLYGGKEESLKVMDGETLDLSAVSEYYREKDCIAKIEYSEEEFGSWLPVLEDFAITLKLEPKVGENENCKFINIPKDMFAENTVYVSVIDIDSQGNTNTLLGAEPMRDLYLKFEKDKTGTIAIYVFADETAEVIVDEIMISY